MGLFSGGGSKKQRDKTRTFSDIKGKTDAEKYVDSHGDLTAAWKKIQANPAGLQGSYWLQRMGGQMTKQAFGEAHRGESKLLFEGKYAGGTKVKKADPKFFSAKATMRPKGEKVGMRNPVGPKKVVAKKKKNVVKVSTSTTSGAETTTSQTNTTTSQVNALTNALANAIAAISAMSTGMNTTTASTTDSTTSSGETVAAQVWPGAPDWVKNFDDYRKWLRQKSESTGFLSTLGTSSTGMTLDDYIKNIKITALGT